LAGEIARYLERRRDDESPLPEPAEPPPGAPIGMEDWLGNGCSQEIDREGGKGIEGLRGWSR
ncbi:MAG TPA: hypothetical protein VJG13_01130, partial [Thermoanaerobaculia bacterium]|nr:hypothetical protein [Thermoanaerobaculia bacterium]